MTGNPRIGPQQLGVLTYPERVVTELAGNVRDEQVPELACPANGKQVAFEPHRHLLNNRLFGTCKPDSAVTGQTRTYDDGSACLRGRRTQRRFSESAKNAAPVQVLAVCTAEPTKVLDGVGELVAHHLDLGVELFASVEQREQVALPLDEGQQRRRQPGDHYD